MLINDPVLHKHIWTCWLITVLLKKAATTLGVYKYKKYTSHFSSKQEQYRKKFDLDIRQKC